ncbi:MAG: beta strand repeat-containing protein [Fimbriiglobus sp.]
MFARLKCVWVFLTTMSLGISSQAQHTWNQPPSGNTGTFSAATWLGGAPGTGSPTAIVGFHNYHTIGAGSFVLTQDVASLTANQMNYNNFRTDLFTMALGANPLTMGGTSSLMSQTGPGNVAFSGTGGVSLNDNLQFTGLSNGALTINPVISGGFGLAINRAGLGPVSLLGGNTFTGGVILNNGYLQLGAAAALGPATNVLTVNGGAVRFNSTATIPNNIVANSTLVVAGGTGASSGASTSTLTGVISGAGGLRVANYNTGSGPILQGTNTFTGPMTISSFIPTYSTSSGTVTLSGAAGSVATNSITIGKNATLAIVETASNQNADRIPNSTPITLNGGRLNYSPVAGSSETLGAVTIRGQGQIGIPAVSGTTSNLTLASITREDNAQLVLLHTTSPSGFGLFLSGTAYSTLSITAGLTGANAPISVGNGSGTETAVVPWAVAGSSAVNPRSMVGYDSTNGLFVIPHDNATFVVQQTPGTLSAATIGNKNVHFNGVGTYDLNGATIPINSLTTTANTVTISNGTITIGSGFLTNRNQLNFTTTTLNFGSSTGYIHASYPITFNTASTITGSGGLVIGGQGFANLNSVTFQNTAGNPFTGGLTVNGSTALGFRQDNQLGAAAGSITLGGGFLSYNAAADLTISRAIKINEANGGINFNIVDTTNGTAGNATSTTNLTLSGVITGNGAFIKEGVGIVTLSGTNTYSGGTVVTGGTLRFLAENNLGAATSKLTLNGGILAPTAAVILSRPLDLNTSSTIDTGANAVTISGAMTNVGALYGTAASTLTKAGSGILTISGDGSLLSATVAVSSGGLTLSGANGNLRLSPSITLAAGTNLTIDNSTAYNPNRMPDGGSLIFSGAATTNYMAGSTATSDPAERFGLVSFPVSGSVFSVTGGSASPTILRFASLNNASTLTLRGTDLGGTSGNYTRILIDSFTSNLSLIPNVFWDNSPGSGASTIRAGYDLTRGVIQFTPVVSSGTEINNFTPVSTSIVADYTTTGNTTAATGSQIYLLTLDGGSTLTLNGGNVASGTNGNTPDGTLLISGGGLTSQNGAKTITSGAARTVHFGASLGVVTTTSNLTLDTNVTLSGTGGLAKNGTGNLTINGGYAVTGPTSLNAGTVTLGAPVTFTDLAGIGAINAGANTLTVSSTNPTSYLGAVTTTAGFVKAGPGVFTFSPSNTPTFASASVQNGTLVLGNSTAGGLGTSLSFGAAANTSGILELGGNSIPSVLTSLTVTGTGTAHRIINSNTTTQASMSLNLPADATLAIAFGGNISVTKTDSTILTLTGTSTASVTAPPNAGVFNINAGTVRITAGNSGFSTGMNINVAAGATLVHNGASVSNSAAPYGTVTLASGATWSNTGSTYYDPYFNKLVMENGSSINVTTVSSLFNFVGSGASFTVNGGATAATISATGTSNLFVNGSGSSLPVTITRGTSTVDLTSSISLSSGGFTKLGNGVWEITNTGNPSPLTVSAGTVIFTTPSTASGLHTVNNGGRLVMNGAASSQLTVNTGGILQGTGSYTGTTAKVIAGTIAPGNSAGTITFGTATTVANVNLSNSTYAFEMANVGTAGVGLLSGTSTSLPHNNHDIINILGTATSTVNVSGMVVNISGTGTSFDNTQTYSWIILSSPVPITGTPTLGSVTGDLASVGSTGGFLSLSLVGNNVVLDFNPVPEPGTILTISALGLMGVAGLRRLRRRQGVALAA